MPGHPEALTTEAVVHAVREVLAEVLFVSEDLLEAQKSLVADLGAESIDFLDIVFRLEDVVGRKIDVKHFDRWSRKRLADTGQKDVTVDIVTEFALEEAGLS